MKVEQNEIKYFLQFLKTSAKNMKQLHLILRQLNKTHKHYSVLS